ncbi:DUF1214 domain-containing protein, partial [Streptomyces sp. NPDC049910]|uniref:DUF1214 domain-containing protein n=1 Tax=Streptomyces sp. NPDC049910 TaxID=3155278 RepID=UPI00344AE9A2
ITTPTTRGPASLPRPLTSPFHPSAQDERGSLTAYTPEAITLIPNPADKYVVASYTPGLEKNPDGSLSIYISRTLPNGVNPANWLPVREGTFNVMLRAYGPQGSALDGTYVPPAIAPLNTA